MQKEFYKLEFIKNYTDHESEIRVIYCDNFEAQRTESGDLFYVCRFSDGSQKTICTSQFDDWHVIVLNRYKPGLNPITFDRSPGKSQYFMEEKSPE